MTDPRDERIAALEAENAQLREIIAQLEARIRELEARLGKNSRNSSKPPSSDPPDLTRKASKATGRQRGGQPGHDGYQRQLLPVEKVDRVVVHRPARCFRCHAALHGDDPAPSRHQVTEVPLIRAHVTEHQLHELACTECGARTRAVLPAEAASAFGPRLTAFVALLTGRFKLPKRQVPELLHDLAEIEMADGSVCQLEQNVSAALAAPVEQARAAVKEQSVVHMDETGWREEKKKAWLWVAVTRVAIVFQVARSRGSKVAKEMLGEARAAMTLVTDRWSGYNWVPAKLRQLCWAHLLRDFQGWADRGGDGQRLGEELIGHARALFHHWHRIRDGTLTRSEFRAELRPIQTRTGELLREAALCADKKVAGMAREMLKLEPALWTFARLEGVEPTNNTAERAIRPAVLWRKGCFGTDSERGSRFVERILTTTATLRLQNRPVLEYLVAAIEASRRFAPAPALVAVNSLNA